MASGVATLALKVTAIAAALALLVMPSLGRCPSLGPAPLPPMQASPPPPPEAAAYASPPPPPAYASPSPPPLPTPPPPPPLAQASSPPPLSPAAQPALAPGPGQMISCNDCNIECNRPCIASIWSKCSPRCDGIKASCNKCKTELIKNCKAGGTCANGSCDCDNLGTYSSNSCNRDCDEWFCQDCGKELSKECGQNCARQCHDHGCVGN
ncbi:hypothetical protein BRADI_4g11266v3 [Brachypodium distachyon]|uniref:TNFR-Cys domain-containing protein n=1 Tax=Brachypodium distachyon TaxID=15368 RepID=A0A2K2CM35_BRADI|nr:hypothetical protein BRADI_4g11266v3 [Brachypodium distachyon]